MSKKNENRIALEDLIIKSVEEATEHLIKKDEDVRIIKVRFQGYPTDEAIADLEDMGFSYGKAHFEYDKKKRTRTWTEAHFWRLKYDSKLFNSLKKRIGKNLIGANITPKEEPEKKSAKKTAPAKKTDKKAPAKKTTKKTQEVITMEFTPEELAVYKKIMAKFGMAQ